MPFLLAQDISVFGGELSTLPWWQYLLVLFLMSPVVLSIVNGLLLIRQNQQKKELSSLETQQENDKTELRQMEKLISTVDSTNQKLLSHIEKQDERAEKRDERYIQAINNLEKTVGGFGMILQQENQERSGVFSAMRESLDNHTESMNANSEAFNNALQKQSQALNANSEAMFALSESQDRAVKSMELTAAETKKLVQDIQASFMQLSGEIKAWGILFQTATSSTIETNKNLGQVDTRLQDLLGYIQTEIGKILSAVESERDSDTNSKRLDKENLL
jgi:hypothetical protein